MTTDAPTSNAAARQPWFRGRPRSWPFFLIASAIYAPLQGAFMLVFHRPQTRPQWVAWFLINWVVFVGLTLFRNPLTENAFSRRLAARTDANASGFRILYLLSVVVAAMMLALLAAGVVSRWGW